MVYVHKTPTYQEILSAIELHCSHPGETTVSAQGHCCECEQIAWEVGAIVQPKMDALLLDLKAAQRFSNLPGADRPGAGAAGRA